MSCKPGPRAGRPRVICAILMLTLYSALPTLAHAQPTYEGHSLPELAGGASRVLAMTSDTWLKPVLAGESRVDAEIWRACVYEWDWSSGAFAVTALPVQDEMGNSRVNAISRDFLAGLPRGRLLAAGAEYDTANAPRPIVWIKVGASPWTTESLPATGAAEATDCATRWSEGSEVVYRVCGWRFDDLGIRKATLWERPASGGAWTVTTLPDNGTLRQTSAGIVGEEANELIGEEGNDVVAAGQAEDQAGHMVPVVWVWGDPHIVMEELPLLDGGQTGEPLAVSAAFGGGDVGPAPLLSGWSEVAGGEHKPVYWVRDEVGWNISELPTMVGYPEASANSFKGLDSGPFEQRIAGTSQDLLGERKATLWWPDGLSYLVNPLEANITNRTWDLSESRAADRLGRIGAHGPLSGGKTGTPHAILAAPLPAAVTDLYVDPYATGPAHDGLSWCTAYRRLSEALLVALAGTKIRVADGMQLPDTSGLADPRDATFRLLNDVTIEGGYAGCGAVWPDERNPMIYRTILCGDLLLDDYAGGSNAENCYHVVVGGYTGPTAVLDGVVVMGGNANVAAGFRDTGGGMYNDHGSPTVKDCVFRRNRSSVGGGGMSNRVFSSPTVTGCVFRENQSNDGGGMSNFASSDPRVTGCEFIRNSAAYGGGMHSNGAAPILVDCLFFANQASYGGGMRNYVSGNTKVINCAFYGNTATADGGGVMNYGGVGTPFVNCLFSGNAAVGGGAMANHAYANPVLSNCTVASNTATGSGGGLLQGAFTGGSPQLRNCILWGNSDAGGMDVTAQIHTIVGAPQVDWSCVMGTWTGAGTDNIDVDPQFADPSGVDGIIGTPDDDLELLAGSPCIDNGNDTLVPADSADLDGDLDTTERTPVDLALRARFLDDTGTPDAGVTDPPDYLLTVDRGCYEFPGTSPPPITFVPLLELDGGESFVVDIMPLSGALYAAGWSVGANGLRRPVLWDNSAGDWQLTELPNDALGGEACGLSEALVGERPTIFGARYGQNGRPHPAFWHYDGQGFLLELLPDLGGISGQAEDGLLKSDGGLGAVGHLISADDDAIRTAVVWRRDQQGAWTAEPLPRQGPGLATSAASVAEFPASGNLGIAGWSEDVHGRKVPVIWISAPEPGWSEDELLPSLGGDGWANGIVFDDEGELYGVCVDGAGVQRAAMWLLTESGDPILHTLPAVPGYQHSEALKGRMRDDGTICVVGRAFNSPGDAAAVRWTYAPNGSWTVADLQAHAAGFMNLSLATGVAYFGGGSVIAGVGHFSGAGKSIAEPHAVVLSAMLPTAVDDGSAPLPALTGPRLSVHPNPSNPSATISFELREPGQVEIGIYDLLGRRVTVLLTGAGSAERSSVVWDGRDAAGRRVSSGTYFVRLVARDGTVTQKVLVVR